MMKKLTTLLCCLLAYVGISAQIAKDRVVFINVETNAQTPSIRISWDFVSGVTGYTVYRKSQDEWDWTSIKNLGASAGDTSFTDPTVKSGQVYEYYVRRQVGTTNLYGFVATGIDVELIHYRGEIFVAIDSALNMAIPEKLSEFYQNLVGDGWSVHPVVCAPDWDVVKIKDSIKIWHNINPHRHNSLLLFGDIPVPYSGYLNPDIHPDHLGAWPSDVYFGEFTGNWSDDSDYSGASRPENINLPGDGKFDQTIIPGEIKIQIGRVYLDKLSTFGLDRDSLYSRYLEKDRAYRMNEWNVPRRALIDDALNALNGEYPGRNGFQNGNALVGKDMTITANDTFIKMLRTDPYLFSHASSTGGYTSNKQLNSAMFKTETYSVFQTSFGSYHGDWDINNNLLRAEIAGPGYGLTAVWAGRPQWHFLHMSMGATIGYSTKITQSNFIDEYHETYDPGYGAGWVHVALMGDPTLRLHAMTPAQNLNAQTNGSGNKVDLSWDASGNPNTLGYMLYRSDSLFGIWNAVSETRVNGTTYSDVHPLKGSNWYMVRAVKLEQSPGGTYYNMSQGSFTSTQAANGDGTIQSVTSFNSSFILYPNPSQGIFKLRTNDEISGILQVYDCMGKLVFEKEVEKDMSINLSDKTPGIYIVKLGNISKKIILAP